MAITLFALSGILIAVSSGIMAFIMFTVGRTRLHLLWGFFCLSVLAWGMGAFFIGSTQDPATAERWWRLTHVGIALIPTLFLHFVYTFLRLRRGYTLALFYLCALAFGAMALYGDLLIANMRLVFGEFYYDSPPGLLYPLFTTYFFGLTVWSHWVLYRSYRKRETAITEETELEHARIKYFFLGMLMSFAGGSISFLPVYGIDIYPISNFAVAIYPVIIGYAILRHRLFDIRVAAAQGLTFLLWIFVGVRFALSSSPREALINGLLFLTVAISGVFLVRSVNQEIQAREKLEKEEKALEKANQRLKELDRQKTEFVSIASHQLRSPLTAIKGYASMILEGSYGPVLGEMKGAVERIYNSSELMAASVQDFLDVSRIEQGRMKYDMRPVELGKIVRTAVEEFQPVAHKKGVALSYKSQGEPFMLSGDLGKLKQVFSNLVDNSLKYTPTGSVDVELSHGEGIVRAVVRDSGVGMSKETMAKIFDKFVRADNANKVNVMGTGLGLYIAREFVKSHRGKLWAESEGEGKGSVFIIELPASTQ